jgi:hypothetical protein
MVRSAFRIEEDSRLAPEKIVELGNIPSPLEEEESSGTDGFGKPGNGGLFT